jgi:hypothetical protein
MNRLVSALLVYAMLLPCVLWAQNPDYVPQQPKLKRDLAVSTTSSDYMSGFVDGQSAAKTGYKSGGWSAGGVACGLCLGLIGTLVIGVAASGSHPAAPVTEMMRIDSTSQDHRVGFADGYEKFAKKRNVGAAVGGGLAGTALAVSILLLASSAKSAR